MLSIVLFAIQSINQSLYQFLSVTGVCLLLSGSFLVCGMLIGFIFGIPRILSQEPFSSRVGTSNGLVNTEDFNNNTNNKRSVNKESIQKNLYGEYSNLDQISDWLTKILVGVGLTQLTKIPEALQQYAVIVKPALGNFPSSDVFGVVILIFSSVDGFLIGYLWTRRSAAVEFIKAKPEQLEALEHKVAAMDRQLIKMKIEKIKRVDEKDLK